MAITAGTTILAGDFIAVSAGAGSSGKVGKLDATGKTEKTFLKRFGCRAKQNAGQSYSGGTVMAFAAEDYDDDTMHDLVTNNSRITIKTAGTWLIAATISCTAGSTGSIGIVLRLNGTTTIAQGGGSGGSGSGGASVSIMRVFAVNDYIEVIVNSPSGTVGTAGDERDNFSAQLIATP